MRAGHFIAPVSVYGQRIGCQALRALHAAVSFMKFVQSPTMLAVKALEQVFGQRDGRPTRRVQLVDVVGFLHTHVVVLKLIHQFGQIAIDRAEDCHPHRKV